MDRDEIKVMFFILLGVAVLIFCMFLAGITVQMMTDRSHCVAKVDGQIWYEGPAYALECNSQGASTQCSEHDSTNIFTMMFASRHVISNNIQVECK